MHLEQLSALERWIAELHAQLEELFAQFEDCRLLASVPGIGPIVATALVGTVGDSRQFKNGRQFVAWIGLTPKRRSSGGKNEARRHYQARRYVLRMMLVQGAHAVMRFAPRRSDRQSVWLRQLLLRRHRSIATVALANKIARVAWAVLVRGEAYKAT